MTTFQLDTQQDGSILMTLTTVDPSEPEAERLLHAMAQLTEVQQRQIRLVFEGDIHAAEVVAARYGLVEA